MLLCILLRFTEEGMERKMGEKDGVIIFKFKRKRGRERERHTNTQKCLCVGVCGKDCVCVCFSETLRNIKTIKEKHDRKKK